MLENGGQNALRTGWNRFRQDHFVHYAPVMPDGRESLVTAHDPSRHYIRGGLHGNWRAVHRPFAVTGPLFRLADVTAVVLMDGAHRTGDRYLVVCSLRAVYFVSVTSAASLVVGDPTGAGRTDGRGSVALFNGLRGYAINMRGRFDPT
jgi:hypothetical protein